MSADPLRRRSIRTAKAVGLGVALCLYVSVAARAEDNVSPKSKAYKADYIDVMLKEAWDESSVKPSPLASDAEFQRRLYLDLLGRIPNVKEAEAFLSGKDLGKRVKEIDYVLESPDFAKNMGNAWTVLLIGRKRQERNVDRKALNDWIRQQFAADRPWNEIARELITAKGSNKTNGAVNYTMAHLEFGAVPLTSITTRVFLGQQIQCTQCHDHPSIDEWKQADFWGINAFFKGIKTRDVLKADATGAEVYDHTELFDQPTAEYSRYDRRDGTIRIVFPTFLGNKKISQSADVNRREKLGDFITASDNDQFPRAFVNRLWGHMMGKGFVNPVDDFGPHNQPSLPDLLDKLTSDFKASGYNAKSLARWIANCKAYQLSSVTTKENEKDDSLFSHMLLKPMNPEQLFDSLLTATSAHKVGGGGGMDRQRDAWLGKFIFTFSTDEGEESSSFQGTIPQALMMMNGELMDKAVGGKQGSFLADALEQAQLQRRQPIDVVLTNRLYLASLSRYPSKTEATEARHFLQSAPDKIQVMEDLFWALLNSNEFILNH